MSHHHLITLMSIVLLCVLAAIPLLILSDQQTDGPESVVQNVSYREAVTVGVILSGSADTFGWPAINGAEYVETRLGDSRVILYDNLNTTTRPDVRLQDVVAEMVDRGAHYVFISTGHVSGLDEISVDETYTSTVFIMNLAARADVETLLAALAVTAPDIGQVTGASNTSEPETAERDRGPVFVLIILVVILLVSGLALSSWWNRFTLSPDAKSGKKKRASAGTHGKAMAIEEAARARITNFEVLGDPPPLVHKLSTYVQGDNHFDESFQIEKGKLFLGQCGIGPSERVNQYERDKIAAFEVWLFDKNDIKTVTHLLVSEYASRSQTFQTLLETKGKLVLAEPDAVTTLETKTLRVQMRVLDMQYGFSDTLPQRSFFEHLVVEIAAWEKN